MHRKSLVLLNKIKFITHKELLSIFNYFPRSEYIFKATRNDLLAAGLKERTADYIISLRRTLDVDKEIELIEKKNIFIIDWFSPEYPPLLKEIADPPFLLYVKGKKEVLSKMCFAIVGSRLASVYGMQMAERFAYGLANLGIVIVSGLARGIDTSAHRAALKRGLTVAVLGSGFLNVYPCQNRKLLEEICESGAAVSEFPLDEPSLKENFPRRNRIISGLSKGVLVVEASYRSGALITARFALEQNREVFAIPGKADSPLSKGPHVLIKDGAKLVDSLGDILEELNIKWEEKESFVKLSSEEKCIFDIIGREGMFLEEIIVRSRLDYKNAHNTILELQLKGLIEEKKPLYFVRKVYG